MIQKILFFFLMLSMLAFQNCSKTEFATQEISQNEKSKSATNTPKVVEPPKVVATNDIAKAPSIAAVVPVAPPPLPAPSVVATGKFYCLHRGGASDLTEDLYERFTDGSFVLKERCSDWHSTAKENHGFNCGTPAGLPLGQGLASCCPQGSVTVNGHCVPESGLGEACFANANCKAGLSCSANSTCQPKF